MVMAFAATAFAVDVKLGGSFEVKGIYTNNLNGYEDGDGTNKSWWEQDGNVQAVFTAEKGTRMIVRGDFRDGTWGTDDMKAKTAGSGEKNFTIQRAYIEQDFGKNMTLYAGLMKTGAWGTAFGDNGEGNYRVKFNIKFGAGTLSLNTTKNTEIGKDNDYEDAEKDDSDSYGGNFVGKYQNFKYGLDVSYKNNSTTVGGMASGDNFNSDSDGFPEGDDDGDKTTKVNVLFAGDFSFIGFESEFGYANTSTDQEDKEDYSVYGVYVNVFGKLGAVTPGIAFMYGSVDESHGFAYGDDFDSTLIIDERGTEGMNNGSKDDLDDLVGYTTVKPYVTFDATDALSITGAFAYFVSNWDEDDNPEYSDIDGYEVDIIAAYKINKSITYTVGAAYAQINSIGSDDDNEQYDSDPIYYLSHRLNLEF
jgi:hypothetical protein